MPGRFPNSEWLICFKDERVPAYLEPFDDSQNIIQNLREHFITPTNVMLNDAVFLLREQVEEPRNYMALLEAIAGGARTKQILFGECKWGRQPLNRKIVDKLIVQSAKALPGKGAWQQNFIFFSRVLPTKTAQQRIAELDMTHLSIEQLETDQSIGLYRSVFLVSLQ